jgi:hypothetical protein
MSKTEQDIDTTKPYEQEVVATAVPASNEPPIPTGHARFYCSNCHTVSVCVRVPSTVICLLG